MLGCDVRYDFYYFSSRRFGSKRMDCVPSLCSINHVHSAFGFSFLYPCTVRIALLPILALVLATAVWTVNFKILYFYFSAYCIPDNIAVHVEHAAALAPTILCGITAICLMWFLFHPSSVLHNLLVQVATEILII